MGQALPKDRPAVSLKKRGRLSKRNAAKYRKRAMVPERARVAAELAGRLQVAEGR